jgi:hypothetical protein
MSIQKLFLADKIELRNLVCVEIIWVAGEAAQQGFEARCNRDVTLKGPQDFLIGTDLVVGKLIGKRLSERFPLDGFLFCRSH